MTDVTENSGMNGIAAGFESAAEIWYDSDATIYENRQHCLMEQCKQLEVNLDNEIKSVLNNMYLNVEMWNVEMKVLS